MNLNVLLVLVPLIVIGGAVWSYRTMPDSAARSGDEVPVRPAVGFGQIFWPTLCAQLVVAVVVWLLVQVSR